MALRTTATDAPRTMIPALPRRLALCLWLLAAAAQAQSLNLIGASPVSRFTEADLKLMMATVDRVLADPADGVAQAWNNEATAASGTVTARRTYTAEGRKCRELLVANRFRTLRGEAEHSFCQDAAGQWKLVQ
jgi:surface antigen